mmetsp:Transcript_23246/g.49721  ORF Transcript_23246/g.49721 Transcript_23246/m.49721 type:complete len:230 (-) Transcript_23246:357-1046(-)
MKSDLIAESEPNIHQMLPLCILVTTYQTRGWSNHAAEGHRLLDSFTMSSQVTFARRCCLCVIIWRLKASFPQHCRFPNPLTDADHVPTSLPTQARECHSQPFLDTEQARDENALMEGPSLYAAFRSPLLMFLIGPPTKRRSGFPAWRKQAKYRCSRSHNSPLRGRLGKVALPLASVSTPPTSPGRTPGCSRPAPIPSPPGARDRPNGDPARARSMASARCFHQTGFAAY